MKVVHIFKDFYPPTTGGIEQHMYLLSTALARDVDVTVLVPSRSTRTREEWIDGVRVVRTAEFGRYASAPLCPTMPLWLRRLAPDIVHVHFPNPMGDLTYLLSGVTCPLVVSYHADIIRQRALLPYYRPVLRRLFRRAAGIIAASEEYVESSEDLRQYRERTVIIPYGIQPSDFSLRGEEVASVERLKSDAAGPFVLFVGALRYYKGVDVLIRAMPDVRSRLVIAGRGSSIDLESLAQQLGVADRTQFAGEVSQSELRILLHAARVVVLPSIDRCEAFGIVQLEAMACGKPVVATDLPTGVRHVNRDGVTGLIVPPADERALAAALNRLLDDPRLCERFGEAGRRHVEEFFTAERMVAATRNVYARALRAA